MNWIAVLSPGLLTTVQDLGRPGGAQWGVSASGAADALALRAGNLILGNNENAPALEMTLTGGTFTLEQPAWVLLAGAPFEAHVAGAPLRFWQPAHVAAGDELCIGAARAGARCYLCVQGGFAVAPVLASASTHVMTRLGGFEGRALRAGDRLPIGPAARDAMPAGVPGPVAVPDWIESAYAAGPIRVTRGPQWDWFTPDAEAAFVSAPYAVREQSNRMGIRLLGPVVSRLTDESLWTEGVSLGAVQIDGTGQPIILFVEHQTTGGYPKFANVCSADLHRLGQLRPRDLVQFEFTTFEAARAAFLQQEERLQALRDRASA